jgi:hypothetical protein
MYAPGYAYGYAQPVYNYAPAYGYGYGYGAPRVVIGPRFGWHRR